MYFDIPGDNYRETKDPKVRELIFFVGTTAEVLKIYPVLNRLPKQKYRVISSGQQDAEMRKLQSYIDVPIEYEHFNLPERVGIQNIKEAILWGTRYFQKLLWALKQNKLNFSPNDLIIVHGDTLTCLITASAAFIAGKTVVHIEAGLRSGSILHPFPEEITRRIVSRIATYHFYPNELSGQNLRKYSGVKISTAGNTGIDTLFEIDAVKPRELVVRGEFLLFSLHRNELFEKHKVLVETITEIVEALQINDIILVCDKRFRVVLDEILYKSKYPLGKLQITNKLPFPEFKYLLERCKLLVTDSGGQQEEAAVLGLDCLVHRRFTERTDGFGSNALLSRWERGGILDFINSVRPKTPRKNSIRTFPSSIVADMLLQISENNHA